MSKSAINPKRSENFPAWYQEVIKNSDLAENSSVRGCMVIKPWGYAIWQRIERELDERFQAQGHQNAYFPLLIPLSYLEKEAEHVSGFAKECAVVTHSRLLEKEGKLVPEGALEEPLIIRPTSETIIGECFAKWIDSYRDLPLKINQWANVMRWEKRTRMFLRTSEFLWQEGHTAHATEIEAKEMTQEMINTYSEFCEEYLSLPVIIGEKTKAERFPGAQNTLCIESMMQDKKALQTGTSHFLGQTFAKAANISFNNKAGVRELVWTTSWGVSTRLIGAIIMSHSDDDGLVLPPTIAPKQVVIMPVLRKNQDNQPVLQACKEIGEMIKKISWKNQNIRVHLDLSDTQGSKHWQWLKKGVPIRIEIGPRDLEQDSALIACRTNNEKTLFKIDQLTHEIPKLLSSVQETIFNKAKVFLNENIHFLDSWDIKKLRKPGFYKCYATDCKEMEQAISDTELTVRCLIKDEKSGKCIFTGEMCNTIAVIAKAY